MQVLNNISNRTWETIIRHAMTCRLDDKLYLFRTVCGTGLLFDSIYRAVGVSSDGQTFHSVDSNDAHQMVDIFSFLKFLLLRLFSCFGCAAFISCCLRESNKNLLFTKLI